MGNHSSTSQFLGKNPAQEAAPLPQAPSEAEGLSASLPHPSDSPTMSKSELDSDRHSTRHLSYMVGGVMVAGFTFALLRMLLPLLRVLLPALVGWWLWRRWQKIQKTRQDRLNSIFYQLLQEHQGHITVLDFAMTAKLTAIAAKTYLDDRAKDFSAHFDVSDRGDVIYLFPTLKTPGFQPNPPTFANHLAEEISTSKTTTSKPLTQAELARRLSVSASIISRKKHSPDLAEWTRSRDPDGVGWAYLEQTRRFVPAAQFPTDAAHSTF